MCVLGIFSLYIIQLTLSSYFVDYIAALIFLYDFTNQFFLNSNFENRFRLLSFRKFFQFQIFFLVDFFFSLCLADFTILQFITPKHTFQVHPTVLQHRNLTHILLQRLYFLSHPYDTLQFDENEIIFVHIKRIISFIA